MILSARLLARRKHCEWRDDRLVEEHGHLQRTLCVGEVHVAHHAIFPDDPEVAIGVGSNVGSFGLLVGVNYGLVTYSSSSGKVTDFIIIGGGGPDGGLVGSNYGTVERSSSSASVLTQGDAGGLVGDNYGTIAQSFVTGSVGRGSHGGTGGIVGTNAGLLTQSYATGYAQDAGLADDNTATGIIDQSFAANLVSGPGEPGSFRGGIAFYNYGAIHNNVYWDRTVTTQTSAFTIGNGTAPPDSNGLTTTQMSNASNCINGR